MLIVMISEIKMSCLSTCFPRRNKSKEFQRQEHEEVLNHSCSEGSFPEDSWHLLQCTGRNVSTEVPCQTQPKHDDFGRAKLYLSIV